jgi:hypothetical protein
LILLVKIFSSLSAVIAMRRVYESSAVGKNPERKRVAVILISSEKAGFLHTDIFDDHCYF